MSESQTRFSQVLFEAGLLVPTGESGVYGRGAAFEAVRLAVEKFVSREAEAHHERWERIVFPPLVPRRLLEEIGYLKSFPHLAGSIFAFNGSEAEAQELYQRANRHEDWSEFQTPTNLMLLPAACYPVYPVAAARGELPMTGLAYDLGGAYVFRNEPSSDAARLQMFHQRELVRIASSDVVLEWRERWLFQALAGLQRLGLEAQSVIASDPFFGRRGRVLASSQREQTLKFEVVVPIAEEEPTACASFNYHQQHFGVAFGIRLEDGSPAHSACLGFGEERIALALFWKHGLDPDAWAAQVRAELWPDSLDDN